MTSNTAYSEPFSTLGPASPDGASDAPHGPVQYPDMLDDYAYRPPWHVAGVDYRVGLPDDITLTDWHSASVPGSSISGHQFRVDNQTSVVIDSIDFSTHGGAAINLVNCQGISITNCKFGGTSYPNLTSGIIATDPACSDLTIRYNTVNGALAGLSSSILQLNQITGTVTVEYNWFGFFPSHVLSVTGAAAAPIEVVYRYNLLDQGAWVTGAHFNVLEWAGGSIEVDLNYSYNTVHQTMAVPANGEAVQTYVNGSGNYHSPYLGFNTTIAQSDSYGAHIEVSYVYHLTGAGVVSTVTGSPRLESNYQALPASYGAIYPGTTQSTPPYAVSGTTDMLTGGVVGDQQTTAGTLEVLHIAPTVAGGVTVVSGRFVNNSSSSTFSLLDGELVTYLWGWASHTAGLGASATGYFAFAIDTPAAGDHVVSVHGSDGVADIRVPFTVSSVGSPSIGIATPAPAIEGTAQAISGTWANMAPPIGFQYQVDSVGFPVNAVAPVVGNGTWEFNIPAPATFMFSNDGTYVPHTLTVTAFSENVSATTGIFTNLPAPTLTVLAVPNDVPHNSSLTITGQFGGTLITGLKYGFDSDSLTDVSSPTIGSGPWTFTALAPVDGVSHTITVQGKGANTSEDTSAPFYTSAEIFPPGAPGIPSAFLITPSFMALIWTAPISGSPVDTYAVQFALHGSGSWSQPADAGAITTLQYVLTGLAPTTDYDVRVRGTNLGGTGPFGTNTTGITTLTDYNDGAAGAPAGVSPQLPTILDGYPDRPVWNVAGVDYGVGPPAATSFTPWDTYVAPGVTLGTHSMRIDSVDDAVIDGVDFSASGGALLFVANCQRLTITNCKFGNTSSAWTSVITGDTNSADMTVTYCTIDITAGAPNTGAIWIRGGGTIVVQYVWCPAASFASFLTIGDKAGAVTAQYNVVETSPLIKSAAAAGFTLTPDVEFNTAYCVQPGGSSAGLQIGDTLSIDDPKFANNTLIAAAVAENISFWFGYASFQSGTGFIYDNWVDPTSTFGTFYGSSGLFTTAGWFLVNNIDLVTGNPIT